MLRVHVSEPIRRLLWFHANGPPLVSHFIFPTVRISDLILCAGGVPESLVRSVIRQSGGWSFFKEMAPDVANYGASAGFNGWTWYFDTVKFAKSNRQSIAQLCANYADDIETGILEMIQGFGCIGKDYSLDEIGQCLYGSGQEVTILNGLAWFALEEVSRIYSDNCED
jgi:hypothetical protein